MSYETSSFKRADKQTTRTVRNTFIDRSRVDEILKDYYNGAFVGEMKFDDVVRLSVDHSYGQQTLSVLKIVIPKRLKYGISNVLRQMNITSETMYPGLDGLARSMSCLRDSMGDYTAD